MFCTAQDGTALMFPTFLQIILDLYRILYIRMRGLRLLKFRCMRLICCLSVYLLEMVRQHCPVGFLGGQMYKRLLTTGWLKKVSCYHSTTAYFFEPLCIFAPCEVVCFFVLFSVLFVFFASFSVYLGTIYIINK